MTHNKHSLRERVQWFVERCREAGLKATHQRMEIYRELAGSAAHPDAESVYRGVKQRIPAISLDTVYRNLKTLEEHGVIRQVAMADHRMRFDADLDPHHHFVCTSCGAIQDFHSAALDSFAPPASTRTMGDVDSIHIELRGVCRSCQREPSRAC